MFELDERLHADCLMVGNLELSVLLMSKDANYPWFILVPRRAGITEIMQLNKGDQLQLLEESVLLGEALMDVFKGDKLNVAAIGNVVSQLHIHHIVRFRSDACWPKPVWGQVPAREEDEAFYRCRVEKVAEKLEGRLIPL